MLLFRVGSAKLLSLHRAAAQLGEFIVGILRARSSSIYENLYKFTIIALFSVVHHNDCFHSVYRY